MPLERFHPSLLNPEHDHDEDREHELRERRDFYDCLAKRERLQHPETPQDYVALARCINEGADTMVPDSAMLLEIVKALLELIDARHGAILGLGWDGPARPIPDMVLVKAVIGALFSQIKHCDKIIQARMRGQER